MRNKMAKKDRKTYHSIKKRIVGVILIIIAVYYLFALLYPARTIPFFLELINNISKLIGLGKYFIFIFLIIEGVHLLFNLNFPNFYNKIVGITVLLLIILAFIHLKLI